MIEQFKGYKGQALSVLRRFHIRVWSEARIKTNRGEFMGIVLPRAEGDDDHHIVLKLATGYNVGIAVNTITDMKEIGYPRVSLFTRDLVPRKSFQNSLYFSETGNVPKRKSHAQWLIGRRNEKKN